MIRQNFDKDWLFEIDEPIYKKSKIINLPHDYSIEQERHPQHPAKSDVGYFAGGFGVYTKKLFTDTSYIGKKVIIEFEGVYMNSVVYVNGEKVGENPYGYTSFHCDITNNLIIGDINEIKVTVDNTRFPNSRWYSGSGIYRHVNLLIGDEIHITPWGVCATTPKVSENESVVNVKTTLACNPGAKGILKTTLLDADGKEAASDIKEISYPKTDYEVEQKLTVSPAVLWCCENPYLYTLISEIITDDGVIDRAETTIGIREIAFTAKGGFQLNGKTVKLKGGCVHHDCGILGSASYDRAEERKIELLKAAGYNSVRAAHNPPSVAFLDACDRMGFLCIDEAFDGWKNKKNLYDYGVWFDQWWQRDIASMVYRDRNHPSIIMWSIGNEVMERDGRFDDFKYSRLLADFTRGLDSTRAITNALCPLWDVTPGHTPYKGEDELGDTTLGAAEPLDVVGYNYQTGYYEYHGGKFPDRVICGTETFPKDFVNNWKLVEKLPYIIGDFVWTALDYLGEVGLGNVLYEGEQEGWKYPRHHAFCGDIDICGFKRPQSYLRDCVWGISKAPYIAVHNIEHYEKKTVITDWGWADVVSTWSWKGQEGKKTAAVIYCTDDEVEIIVNGKSYGKKPTGYDNDFLAKFELNYEPGTIEAIGYKNGKKVSNTILKTAGAPSVIRLTADRSNIKSEYGDLSYITVELFDNDGNLVTDDDRQMSFEVTGCGDLAAVGNNDPNSTEMYIGKTRKTNYGRAMIVVRSNGEVGKITVTAKADGIKDSSIIISCN